MNRNGSIEADLSGKIQKACQDTCLDNFNECAYNAAIAVKNRKAYKNTKTIL